MATKGKILIVDDDPDFVKTTKMILLTDGYEVFWAEDGKEGLVKAKELQPDLIMLDIMMETLFEGFSFLGTIREAAEYEAVSGTPILMVSSVKADTGSRFSFGDEQDTSDVTPDDYLDKPLKPKELLEKVAKMIRKP
ncbi:MAG: response regulator transcription factor [Syntrophobacteraceae bacterium]